MINLENLRLEDIAPDSIKTPDVLAFFRALDPELHEITQAIFEALIMTRIDELPENIVDLLAWQLHVDFYEPLGLDLDSKRALVKNSLIWHRYKGTKYALESMIRILFFDNFRVEEWFKYGGEPYFFRVVSHDVLNNLEQYINLIRAIYELKNERSWLESLRFIRETESTIYIGQVGRRTRRYEVDGTGPESKVVTGTVHIGTVGRYTRRFKIISTMPENPAVLTAIYMSIIGRQSTRFVVESAEMTTQVEDINVEAGFAGRHISRYTIASVDVEV